MFPTFDDVYATIKGRLLSMVDATHERDVMERLELKLRPLVRELQYYFNGHTSINTESDFLVFNIKELMNSDANIRNALLFNILNCILSKTDFNILKSVFTYYIICFFHTVNPHDTEHKFIVLLLYPELLCPSIQISKY